MVPGFFRKRKRAVADEDPAERAGQLFDQGLNCAQAVLQANCGPREREWMDVAAAFGGGIGDSRCLCGAVSGGVMALGLRGQGRKAARLVAAFKKRNGTTCCKGLSAPYRWMSAEHQANCRRITVETTGDVARLLGRP